MGMKVRRLMRPVVIEGPSLFWKNSVRLAIRDTLYRGSWWLHLPSGSDLKLDPWSVSCRRQWLEVSRGGMTHAMTLEHLLPLKFAGLLSSLIITDKSLPYNARADLFLTKMLENSIEVEEEMPLVTVREARQWTYPTKRGGQRSFTRIEPRNDGKLVLDISIDYPGLGGTKGIYEFPNLELLKRIAQVGSQGWPWSRYYISKFGQLCGIWVHHEELEWPHRFSREEALQRFLDHRCLDLLGALALLLDKSWLSATVTSVCSGHLADLEVCRQVSRKLVSCTSEAVTLVG